MPRVYLYSLTACLSFILGIASTTLVKIDAPAQNEEPVAISISHSPEEFTPELPADTFEECGPQADDVDLGPIIRKWLRKEEVVDVRYCENVRPQLVDLNEDGIDELAIRYGCSPTGNCSMDVYERKGRSYRQIFADRQMVSYFDKVGDKHRGFRDLQTRSHGSCCDGDQVVYGSMVRGIEPFRAPRIPTGLLT